MDPLFIFAIIVAAVFLYFVFHKDSSNTYEESKRFDSEKVDAPVSKPAVPPNTSPTPSSKPAENSVPLNTGTPVFKQPYTIAPEAPYQDPYDVDLSKCKEKKLEANIFIKGIGHVYVYSFKLNKVDCIGIVTNKSNNDDRIIIAKVDVIKLRSCLKQYLNKGSFNDKFSYDNMQVSVNIKAEGNMCLIYKTNKTQEDISRTDLRMNKEGVEKLVVALNAIDGIKPAAPSAVPKTTPTPPKPERPRHSLPFSNKKLAKQKVALNSKITVCNNPSVSACHTLRDVVAEIEVYYDDGHVEVKCFLASHCAKCNRYYTSKRNFDYMLNKGFVLNVTFLREPGSASGSVYEQWNTESILHRCGYNVGEKDDLSEEERHRKIRYVIDYGLMTREEVVWFIRDRIETARHRKDSASYENAIRKWTDDLTYANNYKRIKKQFTRVEL